MNKKFISFGNKNSCCSLAMSLVADSLTSDWIPLLGGSLRVASPYECLGCAPHADIAGEW